MLMLLATAMAATHSGSRISSRRGEKTSDFIGVKLRGKGSISIELRVPGHKKRLTAAYFTSDKQAAVAHDLTRRLFASASAYQKLGEDKLNFWEDRVFLDQFFRENGMEKFVGRVWDRELQDELRGLALKALTAMEKMIVDRGLQSGGLVNARKNLISISPAISHIGEESAVEAGSSQTLVSPLPDHDCPRSEEAKHATSVLVHESEGELFKNKMESCLFEGNAHLNAKPMQFLGHIVMEKQGPGMSGVDRNGSMSGTDNTNTSDYESGDIFSGLKDLVDLPDSPGRVPSSPLWPYSPK